MNGSEHIMALSAIAWSPIYKKSEMSTNESVIYFLLNGPRRISRALHTSLLKLFTFQLDLFHEFLKSFGSFVFQNAAIPAVQWSSIGLQFRVRMYEGRKDTSLLVIGIEGKLRAKGAHSVEGIQRANRGQIPHPFPHLIICLLASRFKIYLPRLFYLQEKDGFVLQKHCKLDDEIHRFAGVDGGVGLRSDSVIGVGREEGIQKFIVWPIEVIFTGIGRDGAESV
jgi:hypothetical protein